MRSLHVSDEIALRLAPAAEAGVCATQVTVDLDTGVGKCMELMRAHQVRHLPVLGRSQGEEGRKALEAMADAAAASVETKRRYFDTYKPI